MPETEQIQKTEYNLIFTVALTQVCLRCAFMLNCELFLGSLCLETMNPMKCGCLDLAQKCLRCTTSHGVLPTLSKFPKPSKTVAMREAICIHIGQALAKGFLEYRC